MKREKTKLRQAVRRLSVCAARLAEGAEWLRGFAFSH